VIRLDEEIGGKLKAWGNTPPLVEVGQDGGRTILSAEAFSIGVAETALKLLSLGIREKYLVPMFLRNSADFIVIFLALMRVKAIPIMVKMEYRELELYEIFGNSQPQAVVTESDHLRIIGKYLNRVTVIAHDAHGLTLVQSGDVERRVPEVPDEVATINYTYRGYGYPLGSMISHDQYLHGARVLQDGLQGEAGEKMLVILPMSHIFTLVGCILVPLLYQMTSVIVETMHPRLIFQHIHDLEIEYITAVPEIFQLFCRLHEPCSCLTSLRAFVSGGSILTPEAYENQKKAFEIDLLHGYGLTEFTPVSRNMRGKARQGTVGPLCSEVQCRIHDSGSDGVGEILIKTPHDIGVYYHRERESDEAHTDGWFKTGDIGRMDSGHLVFVQELKNTCKINGNLVDLEEVSRAIRGDKEVAEAHVSYGENGLVAKIGIGRQVTLGEKTKELRAYLKENLAGYKIPKQFTVLK